jgi:hypothetical protein
MDADLSRLPIGTESWCALIDHALALGDLAEGDYLEIKGTLPFSPSAARKTSAVTLARAVLGLANRMPDLAQRHLGGHGVILVGLRDQNIVGTEDIDGAALRDALQPYLGEDGPQWEPNFVVHPNGLVLAIVVHPPEWGDRIHACRKEYSAVSGTLQVRDGDVFVRVPGKTQPATSTDVAALERRRDQSSHKGVNLALNYGDRFDRPCHRDSTLAPQLKVIGSAHHSNWDVREEDWNRAFVPSQLVEPWTRTARVFVIPAG